MSDLIEQMMMDMEIQDYSRKTIDCYRAHIKNFLRYFDKAPEELDENHIREYLFYLKTEKRNSSSNISQAFSAIKFLYRAILRMPISLSKLRGPRRRYKLPVVLSRQEVSEILRAVENMKHKAMLMAAYSAGLRVSEIAHLKVSDIDSDRMQIRVERGKGKKDRYTLLSGVFLEQLREYWRCCRPKNWLFPGADTVKPINTGTIQRVFKSVKKKPVSPSPLLFTPLGIVLPPIF